MKLIVGLGNPGKEYEKTRHNVGFMALNALREALEKYEVSSWELSKKFNAVISGCSVRGEKIILTKPMTYMNASGEAVQLIGQYYKVIPNDIIVIHDDKDLPLGTVRMQVDRGHAGHNGVRSIIELIGTQAFTRFRIGIAVEKPATKKETADFVLSKFGLLERKKVQEAIRKTVHGVLEFL